jgi:hypothetical protein
MFQTEYLSMREEQQKRSELYERFKSDSGASQSVLSVFDNLVTLLDDYRVVRQSFVSQVKYSQFTNECGSFSSHAESYRRQNDCMQNEAIYTQPPVLSEQEYINSFSAEPESASTLRRPVVAHERRTPKRPRKGKPSHLGCAVPLQSITDQASGVQVGESLISGRELQSANLDGEQHEYGENSFRSIYTDISESVLSDPQVTYDPLIL